jgi:hypothetical protein
MRAIACSTVASFWRMSAATRIDGWPAPAVGPPESDWIDTPGLREARNHPVMRVVAGVRKRSPFSGTIAATILSRSRSARPPRNRSSGREDVPVRVADALPRNCQAARNAGQRCEKSCSVEASAGGHTATILGRGSEPGVGYPWISSSARIDTERRIESARSVRRPSP